MPLLPQPQITKTANQEIADSLLRWFNANKRDLPWRRTYSPYHVWVSEIMLQQTQMERGVEYFNRWIRRFPDISSLAEAPEDEALKLWEGLGYYSRARNILKAARMIRDELDGILPHDPLLLQQLPGIGPYTARAIASIAYERDVCVVDANVERVLSRIFDIASPVKASQTQQTIHAHCVQLMPQGQARSFNQALMEFGSLVCSPRTPDCGHCPVAQHCQAYRLGVQDQRPVVPVAPSPIFLSMATGVLVHESHVFVQKRKSDDVWANLWEFPGGVVETGETPDQAVEREFLEETSLQIRTAGAIGRFKHSYTRYRVTMHAFYVDLLSDPASVALTAAQEYRWVTWKEIKSLAFPAGHRKLVAHLDAAQDFTSRIRP